MDLKNILAIPGKSGLYKKIGETKIGTSDPSKKVTNTTTGFIVESLIDKKRFPTYQNTPVLFLEKISIYSKKEENEPLINVFKMIYEKESGGQALDPKSEPEKLKKYFKEVFPEYDEKYVYPSDIKRILIWYNILHKENLLHFPDESGKVEEEKKE